MGNTKSKTTTTTTTTTTTKVSESATNLSPVSSDNEMISSMIGQVEPMAMAMMEMSEGELQLQALESVCLSYLDHLEYIIDSRHTTIKEQSVEAIFESIQESVLNARAQLQRFSDNLYKPHMIKFDENTDDNISQHPEHDPINTIEHHGSTSQSQSMSPVLATSGGGIKLMPTNSNTAMMVSASISVSASIATTMTTTAVTTTVNNNANGNNTNNNISTDTENIKISLIEEHLKEDQKTDELFDIHSTYQSPYEWSNLNVKRVAFESNHSDKIYDVSMAYKIPPSITSGHHIDESSDSDWDSTGSLSPKSQEKPKKLADSILLVSCGHDAKIIIWKLKISKKALPLRITKKVNLPGLRKTGSEDGVLATKSTSLKFEMIGSIPVSSSWTTCVAIHPRGYYISVGGLDKIVDVYDNRDYLRSRAQGYKEANSSKGKNNQKKEQNTDTTNSETVGNESLGGLMSSNGKNGQFPTRPFVRMNFWSGYISSLCFVDDDRHILVGSGDGTFSICDYITNKCISRLRVDGDILTCDYVFIRPTMRKRAEARINQLSKMSMELNHYLENDPIIMNATTNININTNTNTNTNTNANTNTNTNNNTNTNTTQSDPASFKSETYTQPLKDKSAKPSTPSSPNGPPITSPTQKSKSRTRFPTIHRLASKINTKMSTSEPEKNVDSPTESKEDQDKYDFKSSLPEKRLIIVIGACDIEHTIQVLDISLSATEVRPALDDRIEKNQEEANIKYSENAETTTAATTTARAATPTSTSVSTSNSVSSQDEALKSKPQSPRLGTKVSQEEEEALHMDKQCIVQKLNLGSGDVHCVRLSPSGLYLAAGGDAGVYRIYERKENIGNGRFVFEMIHERVVGHSITQLTWVNEHTVVCADNSFEKKPHNQDAQDNSPMEVNEPTWSSKHGTKIDDIGNQNILYLSYWLQDDEIRKEILRPYFLSSDKLVSCVLEFVGYDFVDDILYSSLTDKISCVAAHPLFVAPFMDKSLPCKGLLIAGSWNGMMEGFVNKTSS